MVDELTDGAATVASQMALQEVENNVVTWRINPEEEVFSNHIQIRNDENTDKALNVWLFNGEASDEFELEDDE